MDHEQALKLLMDTHTFPGPFEFRVIIDPQHRERVIASLTDDTTLTVVEIGERASRTGAWVSLHVRTEVESAETVLSAWARLRLAPGVVMTL